MSDAKKKGNEASTMDDFFSDSQSVLGNMFSATQSYLGGMSRYSTEFFIPYLLACQYFQKVEGGRLREESPANSFEAYLTLLKNNLELMDRSLKGTAEMMTTFAKLEIDGFTDALQQSCFELKHNKLARYTERQAELLDMVTSVYPKTINAIEPEFGFHFERGEHVLLDETDRFLLYRVAPSRKQVKTRSDAKPVLIPPPFV